MLRYLNLTLRFFLCKNDNEFRFLHKKDTDVLVYYLIQIKNIIESINQNN